MSVFGAHSEEGQVVLRVNVSDDGAGLLCELSDLLRDLNGVLILILGVHSGAEYLAVLVNNQQTNNASMVLDS